MAPQAMPLTSKRLIQIAFLVCLAAFALYSTYLVAVRPTRSDVAHGLVYPMPAHGPPVYVSALDLTFAFGPAAAAIALFALANYLRRKGAWGPD